MQSAFGQLMCERAAQMHDWGQSMGENVVRRVKFYGVQDLATRLYLERVVEIIEKFEVADTPTATVDAIELHNVQQYIENGLLPQTYTA